MSIALCAGYFLVLLDVTAVNVAVPATADELDLSGAVAAWIIDAYAVPLAALLLAAGSIGDRVGHRGVVLAGFGGFAIGSVICAVAPTAVVLIGGRAVQGIGAALALPGTLAMLIGLAGADPTARSRAVGVWAGIGGTALPAGPLLGGLLVSSFGWRSVFWLNVPLIAVAVAVLWFGTAAIDRHASDAIDWIGAVSLSVFVAATVFAVIQFDATPTAAGIAAATAVFAGAVFVLGQRRSAVRLIDVRAGSARRLAAASAVAGLMNLTTLGTLFLLTQLLQVVHMVSPLAAGVTLLPALLPLPMFAGLAARLVVRVGAWRTAAIGLAIAAAGLLIMAATTEDRPGPMLLIGLAVWGTGLGVLAPAVVTAALSAVPAAAGVGSGASNTARQLGGAIGVALFAVVAGPAIEPAFGNRTTFLMVVSAGVLGVAAGACGLGRARS
ncbi:MFS transporter [Gordonia sinesedis]